VRRRWLALPVMAALAALPLLAEGPAPAQANHSWGKYHWDRTSNPFTLQVGDNVSSAWDSYLNEAISDWNPSTVLDLNKAAGRTTGENCAPTSGRIEVCNAAHGQNGWLGIAQIWIARGSHIAQGTAEMNDTYFNQAQYDTPAWRRLVMCQEIAHDFGLDHQDENFNNGNLGSCMDYTSDPDGPPSNEHPNAHDFGQLEAIYGHLDGGAKKGGGKPANGVPGRGGTAGPNNPADFGRPVGPKDGKGRNIVFERDLPNGLKLVTHVTWTIEDHPEQR
jgi:hypothetical protein